MAKKKIKKIIEDTHSGSLAYNRLDMQISQAIHMAVEMFQNLDYLIILDHYDDITIFDNENSPTVVSYYQMKTHEEVITISTIIREDWLSKLYLHQKNEAWNIKELGLITTCVLKITASPKDGIKEQIFLSEKTPFEKMDSASIVKIKTDIGNVLLIPVDQVDLSKFVHMRTPLTIAKHRDIAEQNLNNFLRERYPNITLDMAKTIFNTIVELLSQRQSCEQLDNDSDFETVRKYKGVSKNDISRVIDSSMLVCVPSYEEIVQWTGYHETERRELSLEYLQVLTDEQKNLSIQKDLFRKTANLIRCNQREKTESVIEYTKRIMSISEFLSPIYSELYMLVVVASILINDWRREN